MPSPGDRHALVLGATGFVGRHLVLALGHAGVRVSTANRRRASFGRLARWPAEHGHDEAPADLRVDLTQPLLPAGKLDDVTEVYNCAGAYRFGMQADEARRANVDSVRSVVVFAARLPRLRRLVHVSGYRVGGQDPRPWSEERRRETYRALGAYEASKVEADAVYRFEAERLGVPWSVVNPASVIGDSVTGEAGQYLGLASTLRDLWRGGLPAVPGNARTFELGEPGAPTVVLPGLPVNADTWAPVVTALGEARAADLPGLGMSEGDRDDWPSWLAALVTKTGARHLVGHSIGAAAAVEAAAAHPDAVERLTLVAPFFLQARSASVPRLPARWYLGRVSARALAERLPRAEVTVIPDAGHHPRLTHPEEVAHAVAGDAPPRVREPFSPSGRSARSRG